jgi:hypothetical protein
MGPGVVPVPLGDLEGQVVMKPRRFERGQSVLLFAILMPVMALFLLGILDYMLTNARLMEAVGVADLSAHAGAQEIRVLPDGTIVATGRGAQVAGLYFNAQRPAYVQLQSVSCGRHQGRPACRVEARLRSAGYLLPARWVTVNATGYLAHGVTRGDQ